MSVSSCPGCGCIAQAEAHAVAAALQHDDVDRALDAGLLETVACTGCSPDCSARLLAAREARRFALDARERFRARQRRLAARAAQRDARRTPPAIGVPALPPAAAALLQRALAKAADKR